jgi:hypothetical protein
MQQSQKKFGTQYRFALYIFFFFERCAKPLVFALFFKKETQTIFLFGLFFLFYFNRTAYPFYSPFLSFLNRKAQTHFYSAFFHIFERGSRTFFFGLFILFLMEPSQDLSYLAYLSFYLNEISATQTLLITQVILFSYTVAQIFMFFSVSLFQVIFPI